MSALAVMRMLDAGRLVGAGPHVVLQTRGEEFFFADRLDLCQVTAPCAASVSRVDPDFELALDLRLVRHPEDVGVTASNMTTPIDVVVVK